MTNMGTKLSPQTDKTSYLRHHSPSRCRSQESGYYGLSIDRKRKILPLSVNIHRMPSLDGIRAIAITLVFLSHVGFGSVVPGGLGVTIFFFLSGFLITTILIRETLETGKIKFSSFYLRRAMRLMPPLLAVLIFSIALLKLGFAKGELNKGALISQLLFYYNYYSYLGFGDSETVQGLEVLWSLSVEEHFYLVWPAIFLLVFQRRLRIGHLWLLAGAILMVRCYRFFVLETSEWRIFTLTDSRFDGLLYGCILAILMTKGAIRFFPQSGWKRRSLCLFAGFSIILTLVVRDEAFRSTIRYSIQGIALMPLFFYAITDSKAWYYQPLNWRAVRIVGLYSYSIYLVHFVIIKALVGSGAFSMGSMALIVAASGLSLLWAWIVHQSIEKPLDPLRSVISKYPSEWTKHIYSARQMLTALAPSMVLLVGLAFVFTQI